MHINQPQNTEHQLHQSANTTDFKHDQMKVHHSKIHRCKKCFYVSYLFYENAVLTFLFSERFLFSSGQTFYSTKLIKF